SSARPTIARRACWISPTVAWTASTSWGRASTPSPGARRAISSRARSSRPSERKHRQQRLELDLGLGQLRRRVGVAPDADAGVAARDAAAQQRAAQADDELAVLVEVGPSERAGVPAAIEALERRDERQRLGQRLATDRRRRVQQAGQLDRALR